jgi:O-antigen/teichoic acid export membrane protein
MWNELKQLVKHTSIYGVGSLLGKLAGFLLIPFYTHYLRPAQYGILELLDLTMSLSVILLNMCLSAPLIRFYYEYEDQKDKARVVSTALTGVMIVAIVLCGIGLGCAKTLSTLLLKSPDYSRYLMVVCLSFFLTAVNSVTLNYFRALQRSTFVASLNLLNLVVTLTLNVYFVAFLHLGALGVLCSGLLGNLLITSIQATLTIRDVGLGIDFGKLKKFAIFGAPLIFTNLSAFALNFSDRFFLQRFRNTSVVGVYALGYKFGFMVSFLMIQPFSMIWAAKMYEIAKSEKAGPVFSRFAGYFCLALVVCALGISLVIRDVIAVIAPADFQTAYHIVPLVALSYVFQGMAYYFQSGILIEKRTEYMGVMGLIGLGGNLLLNYCLIPRSGALGAAWATMLSFALLAGLSFYFSQRVYPVPYKIVHLSLPIVAAVPVYLASTVINISSPVVSAAVKLLLLPVFLGILYFIGFIKQEEVDKLKAVLGEAVGRYRWSAAIFPRSVG